MIFLLVKVAIILEILQLFAVWLFRSCLLPRWRPLVARGDVLMIVAIPLVGLFGHNKNVYYGFLFVLPLLSVGRPEQLVRRYVAGLFLFPELNEVYAIGPLYLGSLSTFTFYNAGAMVALAWSRRGRLRPFPAIDLAVWGLFLVDLFLVSRGVLLGGTIRAVVITLLLMVPPYYLIARVTGSERTIGDTVGFLVLGGMCNAAVGLFESVRQWSVYETMATSLGVSVRMSANTSMRAGLLRAGGAVGNYEVFGLVAAIALLGAIAVRQRFTRLGFYAVVALLGAGLIVSQARSAWLALIVGLILQGIYDRRWRRVGLTAGLMALVGAPVAALASSDGKLGQLLGKGGHAAETSDYRQQLLDRGIEEATRHPLAGHTISQLNLVMSDMRQGDHIVDYVNTHLYVVLVGGVGLLLVWVLAWAGPLMKGWQARRIAVPPGAVSPGLPFAILGMTFVYLTFTSAVDRIMSIVAIGLGLMSVCVAVARRSSAAAGMVADRARETARPAVVGAGMLRKR